MRFFLGLAATAALFGAKCGPNGGCFGFDVMGGYLPAPADGLVFANFVFQ